jgi:hypothetical protein
MGVRPERSGGPMNLTGAMVRGDPQSAGVAIFRTKSGE